MRLVSLALALAVSTAVSGARAAEVTNVIDAFDGEKVWDGVLGVRYVHTERRAQVLREWVCQRDNALGDPSGVNPLCPNGNAVLDSNQLAFTESMDVVNIDLRAGLWRDLELYVTVPIIAAWSTELAYADGVDGSNSLVASPVLPSLFGVPSSNSGRTGMGDLVLGVKWAPLNNQRDEGLPSWMVGVEYVAPTGAARTAGGSEVGSAVHVLGIETAISRQFGMIDPYLQIKGRLRFADSSGPFKFERTTQTLISPGHSLELAFGTEIYPWHDPSDEGSWLSIDVAFKASYTGEGREFTELFDALGSSGCDPSVGCTRTTFARGERTPSGSLRKTDGITDVEHYADVGGHLGVVYQPMRWFKARLAFDYAYTTEHFLTFADAGRDLDQNLQVDAVNSQGVNEFNPFYNESTDSFGHRFRVADKHTYTVMLSVEGQF